MSYHTKLAAIFEYFSPDDLYDTMDETDYPFIYDGRMIYGEYGDTHYMMIINNEEHFRPVGEEIGISWEDISGAKLWSVTLQGRIAEIDDERHISFWPSEVIQDLLLPCLRQLKEDGCIGDDDLVGVPDQEDRLVSEWLHSSPDQLAKPVNADAKPTDMPTTDLQKQYEVHLLKGKAKRDVMTKQGLNPYSKKNDWQAASERERVLTPGHKLWAMHSESSRSRP